MIKNTDSEANPEQKQTINYLLKRVSQLEEIIEETAKKKPQIPKRKAL